MTALTLIPSFASNQQLNNKGASLPPWNASSRSAIASLVSNNSNWWSDSSSDVFYAAQNVGNNFDVEFQYGQNLQIWASAKFIKYSYIISNEVINADNSITFDLTMTFLGVVSNQTSYANAGVSVQNRMYMGSQIIMARDGNTRDTYQISINTDNPITFKNINLAPRASFNSAQLQWGSTYPNHEYPNAVINIGMLIFNPLYAWYVPMMTRKNSAWLPLNGNAGKILRRVNHYIAYAYNADGTDRFTTVYPNLNLLFNSNFSSGLDHWYTNQGSNNDCKAVVTTDSDGDTCIHITGTGVSCGLYRDPSPFNQNQITTGSVFAKGTAKIFLVGLEGRPTSNFGIVSTESYSKVGSTTQASSNTNSFVVYFSSVNGVVDVYIKFIKLEQGDKDTPWMPSASEVKPSDYPSYYGSYYGQGTPSQNASDYSWSPMISPIPQTNMVWYDFSIETQGTENQVNKGHNRRRTAGQFLQLPKLN